MYSGILLYIYTVQVDGCDYHIKWIGLRSQAVKLCLLDQTV